ncbi:MAG: 2-keto-4-pentenoate hydratase [Rhodococcus sp. (in: high G+C Gram-positive bacteria)]
MNQSSIRDEVVTASPNIVEQAARRLRHAAATGVPCAPVRDLIGSTDSALAYAVQRRLTADRLRDGAEIVGRKIGLTSPQVQAQLGVDRPDFGVLYSDMLVETDTPAPMERLLQPKVEAEIAFVLGTDLDKGPLDAEQIRSAVTYAVAALEIVDSRITAWDITFADTVADNASSGLFVLGTERHDLASFEPVSAQMSMTVDGVEVSTGSGAACLGDPLNALRWLALTARDFGQPLRGGQVVLSGALGPMVAAVPGSHVNATISGLGEVHTTFSTPADDSDGTDS